jgi:hypothetical protein
MSAKLKDFISGFQRIGTFTSVAVVLLLGVVAHI